MKNIKSIRNFYNIKKLYLVLGLFLVLLLGVGYAILNTTLSINGIAEISKNTWNVHFENIVVKEGNVTPTSEATISDTGTEITFNIPLSKPGDNYSFLVDIVNNGTIDAKLGEILKTGLTAENEKYLIFDVNYKDGSLISNQDALRVGEKQTILVIVGYDMEIENDELVSTDESIELSLKMSYVQDDGSAMDVAKTLYRVTKIQSVLDNTSSKYVTGTSGINLKAISSDTNGKGVYTVSSTSDEKYPISYYRGAVENNNVLFAGFCWNIVRTTETGGVKLVYNGIPNSNGECVSTSGSSRQIGTSKVNNQITSLSDIGYMYGVRYPHSSKFMNILGFSDQKETSKSNMSATNYIYSDTVTYDETTGLYTLVNGTNKIWSETYSGGGNQYKYTCFSETENTCSEVNYTVSSESSSKVYYTIFTSGKTAEDIENKTIVYGNDVEYDEDTGMYNLVTTTTSLVGNWQADYRKIAGANGYHYTCFTEGDTCSEVNYIFMHMNPFNNSSTISSGYYGEIYYLKLQNGKTIDVAFNEMVPEDGDAKNINDSALKTTIDTWYKNNMTNYTSMLEDTVFCNDRSFSEYGGFKKDLSTLSDPMNIKFPGYYRASSFYSTKATFNCANKSDAFTVDDTVNGNGNLIYPVGLLSSDEVVYAGGSSFKANKSYYLYTGNEYWTLTPNGYGTYAYYLSVRPDGAIGGGYIAYSWGIRPSISLKNNTLYTTGDGTKENPYVVEKQ